MNDNIFLQTVLAEIPRLLTQLNRNPISRTYGSLDRMFWHYRTNDISSCRYQEAALTLALLYKNQFSGNHYYHHPEILAYINAALHYTAALQQPDGSFDEWYIHEGSFVGTAFVTAALSEILLTLSSDQIKNSGQIMSMLERAGNWLIAHEERKVFNQMSGAIVALYNTYLLTKKEIYRHAAYQKAESMLHEQNSEGWWNEYGGPDVGYLSITVEYLSRYHMRSRDQRIITALCKATEFLSYFLHPDGTAGGEYMSRNTEYLIPSGFVRLADDDPHARMITSFIASGIATKNGFHPAYLDDRYLCYTLYNWLEAGLRYTPQDPKNTAHLIRTQTHNKYFLESGLVVDQNPHRYFVCNIKKGAAFRLYTPHGSYFDSGIDVLVSGRCFSSHYPNSSTGLSAKQMITADGMLKPFEEKLMKTHTMIPFKAFQFFLGRVPILQRAVKSFLRDQLVVRESPASPISFKRSIILSETSLEVTDTVHAPLSRAAVTLGAKQSHAFIPSAKYFSVQEIGSPRLQPEEDVQHGKKLVIRRKFRF